MKTPTRALVLLLGSVVPTLACAASPPSGSAPPATAAAAPRFDAASFVKPDEQHLRSRLSPLAYHVTQEEGTEPAFRNAYFDHHEAGIYVDVVSGEPLFSSLDKFDSGTGWPSFTKPLSKEDVVEHTDRSYGMVRVEVRSRHADSHLGHVFDDGPAPTGLRYCINSAALEFIPADQLAERGYADLVRLFEPTR